MIAERVVFSMSAAESELERLVSRAAGLGGDSNALIAAWGVLPAGARDLLAAREFERLVQERLGE